MSQKTTLIAGLIGLLFGFLFAGTLGVDFFGSNENNNNDNNNPMNEEGELQIDAEGFLDAYGLTESVFLPITGTEAYNKIDNDDTFVLYSGRSTCPFCQAYVPNLQEAAENLMLDTVFYVNTVDDLNQDFVDNENVNITPTTFIIVNGEVVETVRGFQTTAEIQAIIETHITS